MMIDVTEAIDTGNTNDTKLTANTKVTNFIWTHLFY